MLYHGPVEDGLYMLIANGVPDLAQGTKEERERKYMETIRRFPETFDPKRLDGAEMVTEVTVAPETLMRGFFRKPTGPGWALVGDASYFKHPGTAQGIGDAVEAGARTWPTRSRADGGSLDGYEEWRDAKAAEHYDWSFAWGRFPNPESRRAALPGLGLGRRGRAGPTRLPRPDGRALAADEQGAARALVRSGLAATSSCTSSSAARRWALAGCWSASPGA